MNSINFVHTLQSEFASFLFHKSVCICLIVTNDWKTNPCKFSHTNIDKNTHTGTYTIWLQVTHTMAGIDTQIHCYWICEPNCWHNLNTYTCMSRCKYKCTQTYLHTCNVYAYTYTYHSAWTVSKTYTYTHQHTVIDAVYKLSDWNSELSVPGQHRFFCGSSWN